MEVKFQTDIAKESHHVEKTRLKLLNELTEFSQIFQSLQPSLEPTFKITSMDAAPLSPTVLKIRNILKEKHFPHKNIE